MAAPAARPPGLCCCRKGSAAGPEAPPAPPPPPEPPPDVASASSSQLFSLRHLHLGLELRPEARALAGCLVLELCALRPQPRALVLDVHPALRVLSAAYRRATVGEEPCSFAFSPAEAATTAAPLPPPPCPPPPPPPCAPPCAASQPSTATFLSAPCIAASPLPAAAAPPGELPASPPPAAEPPPPLPLFAQPPCAACPLGFRVDPFTDYGSSLTISLPAALQPHQPFQIIVRYTTADGPAGIAVAGEECEKLRTHACLNSSGQFTQSPNTGVSPWILSAAYKTRPCVPQRLFRSFERSRGRFHVFLQVTCLEKEK